MHLPQFQMLQWIVGGALVECAFVSEHIVNIGVHRIKHKFQALWMTIGQQRNLLCGALQGNPLQFTLGTLETLMLKAQQMRTIDQLIFGNSSRLRSG